MLRIIHIVSYFIHTRQRVQNLHVVAALSQHICTQDVSIFHSLIFHQVRETLSLHSSHVENVGISDGVLREIRLLHVIHMVLLAIELVFVRHFQFLRSDEMESWVVFAH